MSEKDEAELKEKKPQKTFQVRLRGNERAANTVKPVYKKKLYGLFFLWMRFNCLKASEPLRGGSLLFTARFPEIPGTHFVDLGRMKD